mmetsp:Transcript_107410/g.169570  ORF Transcript_107410/g.169570 Transcript_107410/m.169570 type:complete len:480 (-) Transcript_107410:194-1633(-)
MVRCRVPNCLPRSICGQDTDDLFAYTTQKMVKIRDARLGVLSYMLILAIFVYIVVWKLIAEGGYLVRIPASNTVRLTLQQPTKDAKGKTCNPNNQSCDDYFTPATALDYCWSEDRTKQGKFDTLNCTYMDGGEVAVVKTNSIMMTTSVHQYSQSRSGKCENGSPSCTKLWDIQTDQKYYVVDPESFTLLIDHSLTTQLDVSTSALVGLLYIQGGSNMKLANQLCKEQKDAVDAVWGGKPTDVAPCYVPPFLSGDKDFFTIGYLLKSQGVNLDDPSDEPGADETKGFGGIIFNLNIVYSNFFLFSWGAQSTLHYTYELELVPDTEYKESRYVSTAFPNAREKMDLHGILFNVQAAGELAKFDMTNLLLQLTTSLALFAITTTAMNFLAQYVLAYSPFYKHLMYQVSHDFSDLRDANALTDEELDQELANEGVPTHGNRVERITRLLENGWVPPRSTVTGASLQAPFATESARTLAGDSVV